MTNRLSHCHLPEDIILCYEPVSFFKEAENRQKSEIHSGSYLIRQVARERLDARQIDIIALKYEKPKVYINGEEFSASFSHTVQGVALAISGQRIVGCDLELENRKVSDLLTSRMRNREEEPSLYENRPAIQIWTLKEAALKMIGTGLRTPMNSVCIIEKGDELFNVKFSDGSEANICSFRHRGHWLTICYQ
ncbi:MAG TPA: 4'-phosphopantetheinyl transferase superfamily protein [Balneolaceae bacterium]|nr:4'-phosphopantetheinyl transferase superfamily protein [Balneolaceae bacterium]